MKSACVVSGAALAALAGQALGQPVIDGSKDASFDGAALWVQNQPPAFGDNLNTGPCNNNQIGTPTGVTTGIEFAIPLSAIGNHFRESASSIRIAGFINSDNHDAVSNRYSAGSPVTQTTGLGDPRNVVLASIAGNQFVTGIQSSGTAPTVVRHSRRRVRHGAVHPDGPHLLRRFQRRPPSTPPNGSEIDQVYAVVNGETLYLLRHRHLETNFTQARPLL